MLNVELLSEDESVVALCHEIARETSTTLWKFTLQGTAGDNTEPDLRLWDYKPGLHLPRSAPWGTRSFILVTPAELAEIRAAYPFAEPGIVLKPVTRAVLRAVITQRISRSSNYVQVEHGVLKSERDELLQCLLQANLQLQEFESHRTNFLGRALHDFYAPLSALSGYCGLLLEGRPGVLTEQQKLIIGRMQHSVRRLSRMSRAMFQLSVGRNISVKPVLRDKDIRECIEQALHEVQQLADEKQLQVNTNLEPSLLLINAGQIEQVLINLLENACKFSPRRGAITVNGYACFRDRRASNVFRAPNSERRHVHARPLNTYRVDILDSGPGIPAEAMNCIFEEFVSYAGGQDRSRGGLGLAICDMIVQQHDGQIWVQNCEVGAMFSFILPLPDAGCDDARICPGDKEMGALGNCA